MENLISYANGMSANSEVINWLETTGKKAVSKSKVSNNEMEHILDFLVSSSAPNRLQKMSIDQAMRKALEWSERNQKKGKDLIDDSDDIESVHDFEDGSRIVRLKTKKALQREGFLMRHCVGGYDPNDSDCLIYSYRDKKNLPHATFEVRKMLKKLCRSREREMATFILNISIQSWSF